MSLEPPWASGPGEILKHGPGLLKKDSDTNRRLALISIDNAVELMMKTYLGLPRRVTGLQISRSDFQIMSESFPRLLDGLEKYASDKIVGINLGEIEWYHRLRNELYHQGNGLTVEREKVELYAKLADVLFLSLFGIPLLHQKGVTGDLLGEFIQAWATFEREIAKRFSRGTTRPVIPLRAIEKLTADGVLMPGEEKRLDEIRRVRNAVVHGTQDYHEVVNSEMVDFLKVLCIRLSTRKN